MGRLRSINRRRTTSNSVSSKNKICKQQTQAKPKGKGEHSSSEESVEKRTTSLVRGWKKKYTNDAYDADMENSTDENSQSSAAEKSVDLYDFSLSEEDEALNLVLSPVKKARSSGKTGASVKTKKRPRTTVDKASSVSDEVRKKRKVASSQNSHEERPYNQRESKAEESVSQSKHAKGKRIGQSQKQEAIKSSKGKSSKCSEKRKESAVAGSVSVKKLSEPISSLEKLDSSSSFNDSGYKDLYDSAQRSLPRVVLSKLSSLPQHLKRHHGAVDTSTPSVAVKKQNSHTLDDSCFGFGSSTPEPLLALSPVKRVSTPASDYGSMATSSISSSFGSSTDLGSPVLKNSRYSNIVNYASPAAVMKRKSVSPAAVSGFYMPLKEKKTKSKKPRKPVVSKCDQMMEKLNAEFDEIEMHELSIEG